MLSLEGSLYQENATITKHSPLEAPKEGEMRNTNDKRHIWNHRLKNKEERGVHKNTPENISDKFDSYAIVTPVDTKLCKLWWASFHFDMPHLSNIS